MQMARDLYTNINHQASSSNILSEEHRHNNTIKLANHKQNKTPAHFPKKVKRLLLRRIGPRLQPRTQKTPKSPNTRRIARPSLLYPRKRHTHTHTHTREIKQRQFKVKARSHRLEYEIDGRRVFTTHERDKAAAYRKQNTLSPPRQKLISSRFE